MNLRVAIVHLHVVGLQPDYDPETEKVSGSFESCAERFVRTYKQFPPDFPHELVVVFSCGSPPNLRLYDDLPVRMLHYDGAGFCSGAHQFAALNLPFCDFAVFNSARTHFWKAGWLARLMEARERFGDGFYGTMSSHEGSPHLRTNCYALHPGFLRNFPHPLTSRPASRTLESGEWNMSKHFDELGKPSLLVTWDGVYPPESWRHANNIFRRGNQSNCLVLDRHTEIYSKADPDEKRRLESITDPK